MISSRNAEYCVTLLNVSLHAQALMYSRYLGISLYTFIHLNILHALCWNKYTRAHTHIHVNYIIFHFSSIIPFQINICRKNFFYLTCILVSETVQYRSVFKMAVSERWRWCVVRDLPKKNLQRCAILKWTNDLKNSNECLHFYVFETMVRVGTTTAGWIGRTIVDLFLY